MGGGQYSFDVATEARATTTGSSPFDYASYQNNSVNPDIRNNIPHRLLDIRGKNRECMNEQAVVVALDVTRSRGDDAKVVYRKLPTLIGWLELQGYLPGAAICFTAIGDAYSDRVPLQISQWERDNRLDEALSKVYLEEGGGGTGQESYELAAYYFARHTKIQVSQSGKKGYFFFIGDEGFYPEVNAQQVRTVLGQKLNQNLPSSQIFRELQEKFHVFFLCPRKSWQERKADIDAEIAQRVRNAGGLYDEVDVRISLLWNTRDDLDLHVITPSGEEIFYGHRRSICGGELDVDRNVRGETTEPIENIRWRKGDAPAGEYRVYVQNFRFHEKNRFPIPFKIEVDNGGKVHHYEATISPKLESGVDSNIAVCRFMFDPVSQINSDRYALYDDRVVLKQWGAVLPEENIMLLDDPEDIIEVMVGAIGLMEQRTDLNHYLNAIKLDNSVSDNARERIAKAISGLAANIIPVTNLSFDNLPLET